MLFLLLAVSCVSAAWLPCNFRGLASRVTSKSTTRVTIKVAPRIALPSRTTEGATTWVFKATVTGGACGIVGTEITVRVIRTDPSDRSVTVPLSVLEVGKSYVLQGVCEGTNFDVSPCGESFDGSARPDGVPDPLSDRMRSLPPRVPSQDLNAGVMIFYTHDHKARAEGLQEVTPGSKSEEITVTYRPTTIAGLHTIVFWCHGDPTQLCDINPSAMVTFLQRAKSANPGLKTVEMITCNARHYSPVLTSRSYVDQVKRGMSGITSSLRGITLKAMPLGATGSREAFSILLADAGTKSWVYVVAPGTTDKLMMEGQALIRYKQTTTGGFESFTGDIAQRASEVVRDHPRRGAKAEGDSQWSMVFGYFATLRAALVTI